MSVPSPSPNQASQLPAQSQGSSMLAVAGRFVLMALIILGMPALFVLAAIPYLSAGYDLSQTELTVTGAPGASIPFKITIPDTISSDWSTDGVTAQLKGLNQTLIVIPPKDQDWDATIRGNENATTIDGVLTLPSSLDAAQELTGTITGDILYPQASSILGFHNTSLPISVHMRVKLISGLDLFLQSGRVWLYASGILGAIFLGGSFLFLRLYNRVTKIPPLLSAAQVLKFWQRIIYVGMFFMLVYLGISIPIALNTPAPKNEVFILAAVMIAAAFLAVLIYIIGIQQRVRRARR